MADDTTIIEGSVKFRDGRKWKSRWCVMRKLSPVADCVLMQLYADAGARRRGARSKAALALQQCVGWEAGFTLDKQSHTLALLCRELVAVLALESRERLLHWQARLGAHLAPARSYLVLLSGAGAGGAPPGPARLHLQRRRAALSAGVPPRLLAVWDLAHLRRYGVVEGRFCFEGGSHCGKGEGLHVLVTDQAREINRDFDLALQGRLSPGGRRGNFKTSEGSGSLNHHRAYRPDTRLSELNTIDRTLPRLDFQNYEEACGGEGSGAISPYWPSAERPQLQDLGLGDAASVHEGEAGEAAAWGGAVGGVSLERCRSCMSKLCAMSRSSTAALSPGGHHFSPAWTMEPLHEAVHVTDGVTDNTDVCRCPEQYERLPERPAKPTRLDLNLNKNPVICSCAHTAPAADNPSRVGPYENYDVPKLSSAEVNGEYYDTPKRLKECLNNELFKITKSSTPNSVILKKPCGCLLKLGQRRKEPTIVDAEENIQSANCACQRVTDWANNWIKLPYCRRTSAVSSDNLVPNKENLIPNRSDRSALYATIDLSRKTRRKGRPCDRHDDAHPGADGLNGNARDVNVDDGPLANYENLNFALSLEHYENAKDLLRQAGVTLKELDAISANLRPTSHTNVNVKSTKVCTKCGHQQERPIHNLETLNVSSDDYLMMEPNVMENKLEQTKPPPSGYTPMSPIGGFSLQTLKYPTKSPISRLLDEKSASNPTLCGPEPSLQSDKHEREESIGAPRDTYKRNERIEYRKRSSSADSSRFLDDVKEFEGSVGSCGSNSSIETLRHIGLEERVATPCDCITDNKHSDADNSEASKGVRGNGLPLVKRSSCAPGGKAAGNRDSSSSNDSGVSSCSLRRAPHRADFELPAPRRAPGPERDILPRRSKSTDPFRDSANTERENVTAKSSSAEAEVPVLTTKLLRSTAGTAGATDTRSTSSGTSDLSDYIETLSICSSHSSTDTPLTLRVVRHATSTLRPRSGSEYLSVEPRLRARRRLD